MWMIAGIAGGIQPWWHHVGAYHEDRRMYQHRRAGDALVRRPTSSTSSIARRSRPSASCGRSAIPTSSAATTPPNWSTRRTRGFMHALIRARIPYLPIHADDIDRDAAG